MCLIWLELQLLIDIEFNIDEIPGLDPKKDAYVSEVQFLKDLKLIDVGTFSTPVPTRFSRNIASSLTSIGKRHYLKAIKLFCR
jgi:hypothetical protein